ncbi:response regulator transcription factor [Niabella sp.]|uniref:response regulator transcription factor n=1 Tax=Niabella sp. TaxID=1962976 RepID=UPI0026069331|nr:response regulator transcription factor [Niabella sp.]
MITLTTASYHLAKKCQALISKTLDKDTTISNWKDVENPERKSDIIFIISKYADDVTITFLKKIEHSNKEIIFIAEVFTYPLIKMLLKHNISVFIGMDDLDELTLKTATAAVSNNDLYMSKSILQIYKSPPKNELNHLNLSNREIEIIQLIGEELTTFQIATQLYISKRTVDTHRQNVMKKLNVHNNVGLIKAAITNNILSVPIGILTLLSI